MGSIKLTINGQEVTAEAGQTILEAAQGAGIDIPTLCHHPALKPIGACRVCLVEVSGQRTLQPACTFPVGGGLEVKTESPKVVEARKFVLELIFSERNHFCMYCELSGDCELQDLAYRYGLDHMTYPTYTKGFPVDSTPKYFLLDHNRCVLCRRCMRACSDLVACHTLDMRQRGAATMVHADMNLPIGGSSCVSCGTCLDVCPTGALIDKRSAFMGRETQTESVKSICSQCSLGCGIDVVTRSGNVLRIEGDWEGQVNGGVLCGKGRFEPLYETRPRVLTPLVRNKGVQEEVEWGRALQVAADRIRGVSADQLGVLASTHATNEALYLVSKLFGNELQAKQIGMLNASAPALASGPAGSLADIPKSDCILVVGADPAKEQPVASFLVKRAVDSGARLVLVDAEETALAPFATSNVSRSNIRKAVEMAQGSESPVVVYGAGVTDEVGNALGKLNGKARFVALQPGVNTRAAKTYGLDNGLDPAGVGVLYVLAGEQDGDAGAMMKRIQKGTFLVVQASYASPLTERADVVLPMAIWSERSGTLTNTEGVVQEARKATEPLGGARPDWEILSLLGEKLGKRLGASLGEIAQRASQQLH
jgi:formate dehydrogenase major subunit